MSNGSQVKFSRSHVRAMLKPDAALPIVAEDEVLADSQMDWKDGPIIGHYRGHALEPGPTSDSAALFYRLMAHLTQPR